ncbi:MAG: hypothetical protein AB7O45_10580 [Alphaproteobacteria bacterium]
MNVVSFYVPRPENPRWFDYVPLLQGLQWSCDRLGLRHVVLTDDPRLGWRKPHGMETFHAPLPDNLMHAVTRIQAAWLRTGDWRGQDTLFVGADCVIATDPAAAFAAATPGQDWDLSVTPRYDRVSPSIQLGAVVIRLAARDRVSTMFDAMARRCGPRWCDDQVEFHAQVEPIPPEVPAVVERRGLRIAFLPMEGFNARPETVDEPMAGVPVIHFRGKGERKNMMLPWMRRHLGLPG